MAKQGHIIVKNYLNEHSLVESNIISFNNFIEKKLQEIVNEISETITNEEFEITLGKIEVGKPRVTEADGSASLITPAEAQLRNLTYAAPITLELTVKKDGQIDSEVVEIGRIPIMVKSKNCNTMGMSKEDLIANYNDPLDPGGYFIIKGNERVMIMAEDLAENQPFIENNKKGDLTLKLFSLKGTYRIPITITENKEGIFNVSFSRFKDIPAIVLLKALGLTKESDIAKYIGKETDSVIVNLYEYTNMAEKEDAMMFIAEKTNLQGTKKEILDRVKQRIDSYLFPHIGQKKEDRMKKAVTLCKFIKQFLVAKENPRLRTDKDHYANKRVRLSGDLLATLFRVNLGILVRDIQYSLQKSSKRKKFFSIKVLAKSTLFSHRVESAIATGSWTGERSGITQNIDKTNYLATISQLQRVSSMLPGDQENFMARTLHPTHYGRFCPIETPEGTEIGLRKNLAILARVSTRVELDESKFMKDLESLELNKEDIGNYDVFFNGMFIGTVNDGNKFVKQIREKRRENQLPVQMSFREDEGIKTIYISTESGRVLRPLIIVENGTSKLKSEHLVQIEQGEIKWKDLIEKGIIEYLDAAEEENALVALNEESLTQEHTHLEIDPVSLFGTVTSLVPYGNHDQSSRLNRGSKTQKQALGLYSANYLCRLDTDVSILQYPQKPIVRSFVYDTLNTYPAGQNLVVAIMAYEGYNMEDALVLNKGSLDRGLGRSFYFRPYSAIEMNYAGGLKDEIAMPEKDASGYRMEASYRHLEDDGVISPEAEVSEGEVMIGKMSPPKFLSEAREISIRTKKESSVAMRQEEKGIIDSVFITEDNEGNKIVQVKTRDQRIPELGDKFATSHGQKGVIGMIVPEEDVPFTSRGMRPDIIFNPHGLPSRMTVGYLLELLAGKVGSLRGEIVDGTSFSGASKKELEEQLEDLGFRFDGKETMYNGITGKKIVSRIFVGDLYYLKLKYMVGNKMHGRASGKVALLTRQPIEGRARGGALRLGEMEQQALVAHGASLLLKERYDSDKVVLPICTKCGTIAIEDSVRQKTYCPMCSSEDIELVEVSYAFKLLLGELQGLHINTTFELKNKYE
ncbi:MAG: DNA-directed RNA polymerase subunit B' [Candidatus Diapherotrites archaeon ADurb.Bin253]|jgi:DNA-directed RNA polymerase subunit B|nr:MAG: DNA-directed RNA polymerase subunit B' [Candidatus Diapherotrites archaeon ADurb.Bin253]HNZ52013.1 DNA-directed RNA polymerase subunit B [Candidatus Pacearchaeota archaeon]HOH04095.1 DNA-directed RNA polymerase subunit B [Candidatus Pacearchaeota archaeon]HOR52303.1 DNA-directed RNA polymerase subunit B [Candidatus Pacearchaeota archaeon]HOU79319.1 DNA-directed RNA polymerase subunit B [Candidatus Pacearchaeota archaeon]